MSTMGLSFLQRPPAPPPPPPPSVGTAHLATVLMCLLPVLAFIWSQRRKQQQRKALNSKTPSRLWPVSYSETPAVFSTFEIAAQHVNDTRESLGMKQRLRLCE